jgi:hypothetical protein
MTHANHPHFDLAILQVNAVFQTAELSSSAGSNSSPTSERQGLLSSLPSYLTRSSSQPPAWWLDKRAKLAVGGALAF